MVIKINPKYTSEQIRKMLSDRVSKLDTAILANFRYIGEKFVKNARENGNYRDRTGNLRNSIGYVILRNGVQLYENFRQTASVQVEVKSGKNKGQMRKTTGSKEGVERGRQAAQEAAKSFPKGYVLICVAGMEYAGAVESREP